MKNKTLLSMKKLTQILGIAMIGVFSFSFTTIENTKIESIYTINEEQPKVVILDIVDNIAAAEGANISTEFKTKLESLNKENVKVLIWKDLTKGMKEEEKKSIIEELKPEFIMTISFDQSEDGTNKIAAVVSKQNVAFNETIQVAKELTEELNSTVVKNDGVYQTESNYIQDNVAPAIFLSVKTVNEATTNAEIVNKLSTFIENVNIEEQAAVEVVEP